MSGTRRSYTREFKVEAVRRVLEDGVTQKHVAEELGVSPNTLATWKQQFLGDPEHSFPGHGRQKPDDAELTRLRRENARLRARDGDLKKSRGVLRQGVSVRCAFVEAQRARYPVGELCQGLGVKPGTYQAWRTRPPSRRSVEWKVLN